VDYIDSSGIGELVSGFTAVKNKSGDLKLLSPDEESQGSAADHQAVYGV